MKRNRCVLQALAPSALCRRVEEARERLGFTSTGEAIRYLIIRGLEAVECLAKNEGGEGGSGV